METREKKFSEMTEEEIVRACSSVSDAYRSVRAVPDFVCIEYPARLDHLSTNELLNKFADGTLYIDQAIDLPIGVHQGFNPPRVVPAIEKLKELYQNAPKKTDDEGYGEDNGKD